MTNHLAESASALIKFLAEIILSLLRGIVGFARALTGSKPYPQIDAETYNEAAAREADKRRAADVLAKAAALNAQTEAAKSNPYSGPLLSIQSVTLGATKVRVQAVDLGSGVHDFELEIGINGRIHPRTTWPVDFMAVIGTIPDPKQRDRVFREVVEAINSEVEKQRKNRRAKSKMVNDFEVEPVPESTQKRSLAK